MERTLLGVGAELAALVLASPCAGCGALGRLLCAACVAELGTAPSVAFTPRGMPVHAAYAYRGVVARCVRALKEQGDTALLRPLMPAFRALIDRVEPQAVLVPIPTRAAAFRRRGFRVPELLIRGTGATPWRVLRPAAPTADQRGLDREARANNVRGSMRAVGAHPGVEVVIVDDVATTGVTLDEAATVLAAAGIRAHAGVVLAATPRHSSVF